MVCHLFMTDEGLFFYGSFPIGTLVLLPYGLRAGRVMYQCDRHTKKAWSPIVIVPRYEAFALPNKLEQTTQDPRWYK